MKAVHRRVQYCTVIRGVKFLPGTNLLSDSEFQLVVDKKPFKEEIACGYMSIVGDYGTDTVDAQPKETGEEPNKKANTLDNAEKRANELKSMGMGKLKEVIADMNDGAVLRALARLDGRKGIQEAIESRVTDIKSQKGDDLTPETRSAPEGSGEDFADKIDGSKESIEGRKTHTSIPAMKKGR